MVRFKNRWLLVEVIFPSSTSAEALLALPTTSTSTTPRNPAVPFSYNESISVSLSGPKKRPKGGNENRHRKRSKPSSDILNSGAGSSADEYSDEEDSENESKSSTSSMMPLYLPPLSPKNLDGKDVVHALKSTVLTNFGDAGWGTVGGSLSVKFWSPKTCLAIVRCSRDAGTMVRNAASLMGSVAGERCFARVVSYSGTMKKTQIKAIRYHRNIIAAIVSLPSLATPGTTIPPTQSKQEWESYSDSSVKEIEAIVD